MDDRGTTITQLPEGWEAKMDAQMKYDVYELDRFNASKLRTILDFSGKSEDITSAVVMALCLRVEELQREVQQLRRGLAQVVQMPLEK